MGWWPHVPTVRRSQCTLAVAPVSLSLTKAAGMRPGQLAVQLVATALADCPDATLTIELPAELTVLGGANSWRGALAKGEQHTLSVRVGVPDTALHQLLGVVEARRGTALLVRQTVLEIGQAPRGLSKPQVDNVVTAPDGTRMLVLPAREVSP